MQKLNLVWVFLNSCCLYYFDKHVSSESSFPQFKPTIPSMPHKSSGEDNSNRHPSKQQFDITSIYTQMFEAAHHTQDSSKASPEAEPVFAETKSGKLKGAKFMSRGNIPFEYYRGIPYAKPPIKKLRFEPPEEHLGWEGTRDATWHGDPCWQANTVMEDDAFGNEDCLFLDVATRQTHEKGHVPHTGLRPVMVWLHGGFYMGGNSRYYPPNYLMQQDIVFVAINYRLNSFGFSNTEDGLISGNMGLKDQVMALKWIKNNIKYFNGDSERVTIFGESSSGAGTHLHTMSPLSRGLFSGTISMGGTSLTPMALVENPQDQFMKMAAKMDCYHRNMTNVVECMKHVPPKQMAKYHSGFVNKIAEGNTHAIFGPTVEMNNDEDDPPFLPDHPLNLLTRGEISDKPWVHGINSGEGGIILYPYYTNDTLRRRLEKNWDHYAPIMLVYRNHTNPDKVSDAVRQYYLHGKEIANTTIRELIRMTSDRNFFMDSHQAALLHAKAAPVYLYYYAYEGAISFNSLFMDKHNYPFLPAEHNYNAARLENLARANTGQTKPRKKYGACHADELPLMFPWPWLRKDIDEKDVDYEFSKKLIHLWVTFAENGVPDPTQVGEDETWKPINETNPNLEDIALTRLMLNDTFETIEEPFFERLQFWKKYHIPS